MRDETAIVIAPVQKRSDANECIVTDADVVRLTSEILRFAQDDIDLDIGLWGGRRSGKTPARCRRYAMAIAERTPKVRAAMSVEVEWLEFEFDDFGGFGGGWFEGGLFGGVFGFGG